MNRNLRNLTAIIFLCIIGITSSCKKDNPTPNPTEKYQIEGTWKSTSLEYSPTYQSDFEHDTNGTHNDITIWHDVETTFSSVSPSGVGKITVKGNFTRRIWSSGMINEGSGFTTLIETNYSVS